jgi:hypothetical protein
MVRCVTTGKTSNMTTNTVLRTPYVIHHNRYVTRLANLHAALRLWVSVQFRR